MKIGVQLPEVERPVRWPELRAMAALVEETGFDSVWVGDHLLYRDSGGTTSGPWEAWSTLAGIAAVTSRIELGPLVAATAFHNPAMLAKKAATVDEISNGRLVLGLGAGWNRVEFDAYGFPFDRRVDRFREAFTVVRTLLAEGRIDFDGEFHRLVDCELLPPSPRPGGPPLMVGSIGPRMLRITLPHVAAWNAWFAYFDNEPARLPKLLGKVDRIASEVGRDPATVSKTVALLVQFGEGPTRHNSDNPIVGVSAASEALARLEVAGVDHVQLVLDPITTDSIERAAEAAAGVRR